MDGTQSATTSTNAIRQPWFGSAETISSSIATADVKIPPPASSEVRMSGAVARNSMLAVPAERSLVASEQVADKGAEAVNTGTVAASNVDVTTRVSSEGEEKGNQRRPEGARARQSLAELQAKLVPSEAGRGIKNGLEHLRPAPVLLQSSAPGFVVAPDVEPASKADRLVSSPTADAGAAGDRETATAQGHDQVENVGVKTPDIMTVTCGGREPEAAGTYAQGGPEGTVESCEHEAATQNIHRESEQNGRTCMNSIMNNDRPAGATAVEQMLACTDGAAVQASPRQGIARPQSEIGDVPASTGDGTIECEVLVQPSLVSNVASVCGGSTAAAATGGICKGETAPHSTVEGCVGPAPSGTLEGTFEEEEKPIPAKDESNEKRSDVDDVVSQSALADKRSASFQQSLAFTGARPGLIFKLGDQGLGYYVDGYVDRSALNKRVLQHRPWNAGPGDKAIRRGPLGPVQNPFQSAKTVRGSSQRNDADEDHDSRRFMARMVAQRNSRAFQNTLFNREHILDEHILGLLEKFSDPSVFKKKHGYNVHGQMLGKDGKMAVKPKAVKTEEERAKLSWYRKIYEDQLGDHLPSKRLGDSIEARREACVYSRHFRTELNDRQSELNHALNKALKGQTKLEFITEDYHYPGAYDTDGKVILEKGARRSNELHQSEDQRERACSYRFKAIQRFRAAHDDIVGAIASKDKARQKMFKRANPSMLQEIAEDAVKSSGMGVYKQRKYVAPEKDSATESTCVRAVTESPAQLREKFGHLLQAQIKGKDKSLMNEVAALDEQDAEQMIEDVGKGVEVLPGSWRQDLANRKRMQRRRKELQSEIAAMEGKIVCPWRPGGLHIAHGPWPPFIPRDHRPPHRSASQAEPGISAGGISAGGISATSRKSDGRASTRRSSDSPAGRAVRPRTAPAHHNGRHFMDVISARARRVLAAQPPGSSLHSALSAYGNEPFPIHPSCAPRQHSKQSSRDVSSRTTPLATKPESRFQADEDTLSGKTDGAGRRTWSQPSSASRRRPAAKKQEIRRPQSAVVENARRVSNPPRRPATAWGIPSPGDGRTARTDAYSQGTRNISRRCTDGTGTGSPREDSQLRVQAAPGVTVLWARLCRPSSDLTNANATWPSRPQRCSSKRPPRRRARSENASPTGTEGYDSSPLQAQARDKVGHPLAGGCIKEDVGSDACDRQAEVNPSLEDLERCLLTRSWRRVDQRRRVFRGYAERSRRARVWDPGSDFYADGASWHPHPKRASSDAGGRENDVPWALSCGAHSIGGQQHQRREYRLENRVLAQADSPVDMDWTEVDAERLRHTVDGIKAALETRLIYIVMDDCNDADSELRKGLREARELVDSTCVLLGCPDKIRQRFEQESNGAFSIGKYVTVISRLDFLRATAEGVVEILALIRRRNDLVEVFRSRYSNAYPAACASPPRGEGEGEGEGEGQPEPGADPLTPSRDTSLVSLPEVYEKRLELAEYAVAIAESIKLWHTFTPWSVRVLMGGRPMISRLGEEEGELPWPPDPDIIAACAQIRSRDAVESPATTEFEQEQFVVYGPEQEIALADQTDKTQDVGRENTTSLIYGPFEAEAGESTRTSNRKAA